MKKFQRGEAIIELMFMVVGFIILMAIGHVWGKVQCYSRWSDSGMTVDHAVFSGCRLEVEEGKWIPADRFREVDQ